MGIVLDDKVKEIIRLPAEKSKLVLKGPTGSGKTTVLMERYKYLVNELKVPSESILVLVLNKAQSLEWMKKCIPESSGTIWRTSYSSFIREELTTYYPLVLEHCSEIKRRSIKPVFMTFECVRFLLAKVIEARRKTRGIFSQVAANDERIAADLVSILAVASTSDISYDEIANRLYSSTEVKGDEKKELFEQAGELILDYRARCMELGIFDPAIALEIYSKYLLKNSQYKEALHERIQHLLVDNIEECVPAEADFIDFLLPKLRTCLLGYNHEGGIGQSFGSDHQYVVDKILKRCDVVELNKSYTCKDFMYEFSDMLFENIQNAKGVTFKKNIGIERHPAVELRSEMLANVASRVCSLVEDEGYKPSDIVILSTYADPVTEFAMGGVLDNKGIKIKNLARKYRIVDSRYSQGLVTLATLCYRHYGIAPRIEDLRELIRMVFDIDPVRSSILAQKVFENRNSNQFFPSIEREELEELVGVEGVEKYNYVRSWVAQHVNYDNTLPISKFLKKAFLELVITPDMSQDDISDVKKLVEAAENFDYVVSRFKMNGGKHFLDVVYKGLGSPASIFELEEDLKEECVFLATPYVFLTSCLNSRVIILTSISSSNWYPRTVKEIANPHVLRKTWKTGEVYTEELEEQNRINHLALIIRAVVKKCREKLITFESNISANGFENNGLLSEYLNKTLGGQE